MPKGIIVIYNNALEFLDLEIGVLAVFGVVFAIFRESRRLVATDYIVIALLVFLLIISTFS